jgi:hypothetical protein
MRESLHALDRDFERVAIPAEGIYVPHLHVPG